MPLRGESDPLTAGQAQEKDLLTAQFVETLQQTGERQALLHEVLRSAGAQLDPDAALGAAVETMARRPAWANVEVAVPDESGGHFRIRASARELLPLEPQRVDAGVLGRAFTSGRTQLVPDVRADPDYIVGAPGIQSELAVPLRRAGVCLGVLNVESTARDAFRPEDVRLVESLADNVALALDNARLHQTIVAHDERLQAVIRSARDGMMLVGTDGRMLVLNDTALRLLEQPGSSDAWVGRPFAELVAGLGRRPRRALEAVIQVASAPGSAPRVAGYQGARYSVRCLGHGVTAHGVSLGRLVVLRDVTEDKRLEQMREDLARTMVHDLRGPLTVMTAALDMMRALPEAEAAAMREHAYRAALDMIALVDGILDISRLEQGSFPLERRSVALAPLVAELVDQAAPVATAKQLRLRDQVAASTPLAWADPALLQRVVRNLIQNAIKFTPAAGTIVVGASDHAPGWLRLAVEDTGPGIPDDLKGRLFEKFAVGRSEGRGTGLGLAFCRLVVEAHGGRIWLEKGHRGGARFVFTLPTYPPSASVLGEP